jgi:L-lactate dehydrogenase
VIGEHGDSETLTWSLAAIAGTRLDEFAVKHGDALLTDAEKQQIDKQVRGAAYHIIEGKGDLLWHWQCCGASGECPAA